MVPNGSAYANYPSFANNGTKTPPGGSPESAKYALGMVPADTFPAEWANWLFHGATAGITRLNADVGSIKKEINSLLAAYNITPDASVFNQLYQAIEKRISSLYPVGTVYQNASNSTNPGDATMLGFGTWQQITDAFLASRGSSHIGASGGAWNVTLTTANLPAHTHSIGGSTGESNIAITINSHKADISVEHDHVHEYSIITADRSGSLLIARASYDSGADGNLFTKGLGDNKWCTVYDNGHDHSVTQTPHTHTLPANTGSTGSAVAVAIIPTYVGVYTWKRTV